MNNKQTEVLDPEQTKSEANQMIQTPDQIDIKETEKKSQYDETTFISDTFCFLKDFLKKYEAKYTDSRLENDINSAIELQKDLEKINSDLDIEKIIGRIETIQREILLDKEAFDDLSTKAFEWSDDPNYKVDSDLDKKLKSGLIDRIKNDVERLFMQLDLLLKNKCSYDKDIMKENEERVTEEITDFIKDFAKYLYIRTNLFNGLSLLVKNKHVILENKGEVAYGDKAFRKTPFILNISSKDIGSKFRRGKISKEEADTIIEEYKALQQPWEQKFNELNTLNIIDWKSSF